MDKQTAVEWLLSKLQLSDDIIPQSNGNDYIILMPTVKISDIEQAKAMEKEHHRLIYEGLLQNVGTSIKQSDLPTFEQYYKAIYGKEDNNK